MIAVDSSSLVAFLSGDSGSDIDALEDALKAQVLMLPPVVLTEILSDPKLPKEVTKTLLGLQGFLLESPLLQWWDEWQLFKLFCSAVQYTSL